MTVGRIDYIVCAYRLSSDNSNCEYIKVIGSGLKVSDSQIGIIVMEDIKYFDEINARLASRNPLERCALILVKSSQVD